MKKEEKDMIVCTCDTCGRVVDNWMTLSTSLRGDLWKREICIDCYKTIKEKINIFYDEITVVERNAT